jgi:hypothetical protein
MNVIVDDFEAKVRTFVAGNDFLKDRRNHDVDALGYYE